MERLKPKAYLAKLKPNVATGLANLARKRHVSQNSLINEALTTLIQAEEKEALLERVKRDAQALKGDPAAAEAMADFEEADYEMIERIERDEQHS